jgi:hypothetical protein
MDKEYTKKLLVPRINNNVLLNFDEVLVYFKPYTTYEKKIISTPLPPLYALFLFSTMFMHWLLPEPGDIIAKLQIPQLSIAAIFFPSGLGWFF